MIPSLVTDAKGNVYVNDLRRYVKGSILAPVQNTFPIVTPAATLIGGTLNPGISPAVIFEGNQDGVTEVFSLMGQHLFSDALDIQNRLEVLITDTARRRRLMSREILANHVFGSNLNPLYFYEDLFLESQQTLLMNFSNRSTVGSSTFFPVCEQRKFQASAIMYKQVTQYIDQSRHRTVFLKPYWLTSTDRITIPAGGQVTAFFTSTNDIYLTLFAIIASAISTGVAGDVQEMFAFEVFDAKTSRPLQNQPIVRSCGTGTAKFPFVLPAPLMFEPNTTMQVRFTNLITDAATEVFFTYFGVSSYVSVSPFAKQDVQVAGQIPLSVGVP